MATELSPRERVTLALEHQETDRVPIAMVCAGINPPAHAELGAHLQRERGISVAQARTQVGWYWYLIGVSGVAIAVGLYKMANG